MGSSTFWNTAILTNVNHANFEGLSFHELHNNFYFVTNDFHHLELDNLNWLTSMKDILYISI